MSKERSRNPFSKTHQNIALGLLALIVVLLGAYSFGSGDSVMTPEMIAADKAATAQRAAKQKSEAEAAAKAKSARLSVAFMGDSYTRGTGADPVASRWTTLLSKDVNWVESNLGQGGTGYAAQGPNPPETATYPDRIASIVAESPDVVVVSGGRNDLGINPKQVSAAIDETFTEIRRAVPSAKIIALNPWWDDDKTPAGLDSISAQIEKAVESVDGVYVDTGQPLLGEKSFVIEDGVHPNTAGHKALAKAVADALPAEFKKR